MNNDLNTNVRKDVVIEAVLIAALSTAVSGLIALGLDAMRRRFYPEPVKPADKKDNTPPEVKI